MTLKLKRLGSEELEIILATLKEFAAREMPLEKRLEWDREDVCPEALVRSMLAPDIGLHLVFIPEEYGGIGGGAHDVYRFSTEFAKADLGVATAMLAVALGTDPIRVGCTEEQKRRWMTRVAEEALLVAYAVTEPEAGSNVENLKTTAQRITGADGTITHYRLSGVKQFISNGGIADLYTVLAKAPDGPTFFVVERGTPGLQAGKQEEKHGIRLSNTAQVILEDVVIPAENIIGAREGEGIKQSNEVFGYTRLMVAAFGLGAGLAALERAIAYSKERRQFGTLLAEKQGFTHKLLVPNSVRLAAAQAYIEHVADLLDSSEEDRQVEGSVAKLMATEYGNRAADDAIQALGGYGYCAEYEVEKIKRDARILTIYEGTSEIQQNIIGVFRMRQNVKSKGAFYNDMAAEVAGLEHVGGAALARATRFLSEVAVLAFREKLIRQQHAIFELAWVMGEVELALALGRAAAQSGSELLQAQSRIFAAERALDVPVRLLRLVVGSDLLEAGRVNELVAQADLPGAVALQAGALKDMDFVARALTA
ncbi:MAG: acyl-CoA dehydrogenase family protein [Planctomycetes bacterium]|nr:acyl-CoA dehydrogenase family protein [Planctomycetota bacterium]